MQTLSGALCLEAHQLRRSRTTSRILGYISLHYFGASYLVLTLFRLSTESMCMLNDKTSFPIPNVLTAYYKDIKGIVCASGCTKSKVVKRKFEDQESKTTSPPLPLPPPPPPPPTTPPTTPPPPPPPPTHRPPRRMGAPPPGRSLLRPPALRARAARRRRQQGVARAKADAN